MKRYGRLQVLAAKMNPDLLMGDELLKKTGTGNLFMVFGEPDVDFKRFQDGTIQVTVRGVDVYDPTTQRRSRSAAIRPTTSPDGLSTRSTTAKASSSVTRTSRAPTSPTKS
ncbi:hypothetical protein SBA6_100034 [Candidatus Sulfopaludibacter sp. SbA6]|nr:hypothetical protein SBA6_100034 [Candidatus Sulfopaludibacter sp. SbA6]